MSATEVQDSKISNMDREEQSQLNRKFEKLNLSCHTNNNNNNNNNDTSFHSKYVEDSSADHSSTSISSASSSRGFSLSEANSDDQQGAKLNLKLVTSIEKFRVKFMSELEGDKTENLDLYDKENLRELSRPLLVGDQITDCESPYQRQAFKFLTRHLRLSEEDLDQAGREGDSVSLISPDDIEKATESLRDFLKYQRQFRLLDTRPDTFPKEFYLMSGIFTFGHDKDGYPLVWISSRVHRKWSARFDELFKRYVAWHLDCMTNSIHDRNREANKSNFENLGQQDSFVLVFDCFDVGISSVDTEFLKFITSLLLTIYPNRCKYCIIKDLPWILRSVWTLVKSWLPESSTKNTQLIAGKELLDYMDIYQIPKMVREQSSMKQVMKDPVARDIPEGHGKIRLPTNFDSLRDIDAVAKELELSSNEVMKFKNHAAKVLEEHEKVGAL